MDFAELRSAVFRLYGEGKCGDALEAISSYERENGDMPVEAYYWQACFACLLNLPAEEALCHLQKVAETGQWISEKMLRDEPDLEKIRDLPEFEQLCQVFAKRKQEAQKGVRPVYYDVKPDGAPPYPVLLVLHGNNGNAQDALSEWEPARDLGWMVISVQSTELGGWEGSYIWNDYSLAKKAVLDCFAEIREHIDPRRIVLGGFSRGARTALSLALEGVMPTNRVIALAPAPLLDPPEWFTEVDRNPIDILIIGGDKDPWLENLEELETRLHSNGSRVSVTMLAGLGHDYPDDLVSMIREFLERTRRSMTVGLLPCGGSTARLTIRDAGIGECEVLQRIYEAGDYLEPWVGEKTSPNYIAKALTDGDLPPGGEKSRYRLQSVLLKETGEHIGFVEFYHGYPEESILWIGYLFIHPSYQGQAYGAEVVEYICSEAHKQRFSRVGIGVHLKNWPALHFWINRGFDRVTAIRGDKVLSDENFAVVRLERVLE